MLPPTGGRLLAARKCLMCVYIETDCSTSRWSYPCPTPHPSLALLVPLLFVPCQLVLRNCCGLQFAANDTCCEHPRCLTVSLSLGLSVSQLCVLSSCSWQPCWPLLHGCPFHACVRACEGDALTATRINHQKAARQPGSQDTRTTPAAQPHCLAPSPSA